MIPLKSLQRCLRYRTQDPVHRIRVVAGPLQGALHIGNHLVGRQPVISVDGPVVLIRGIRGVVAPCRIPPAGIPSPVTPSHQNDRQTMMPPPVTVVMMMAMTAILRRRFRQTVRFAPPIAQLRRGGRVKLALAAGVVVRRLAGGVPDAAALQAFRPGPARLAATVDPRGSHRESSRRMMPAAHARQ